ncbi:MAG: hypothetical protein AUI14_18520 [Actinobacteria bacterium 13_2_20CM_2_71_6]|nr:MAG: hypothetical protein AUI14_18520 [Actinobacteria bacterium 13_2_20CM_2_71_6]
MTLSDNFHFCRVTVTQCTIGGLTAGNSYYATVVAFDSVDDSSSSPDSSPSETVIPGPPNPVQSQSAAITGSGTATVQWVRPTNHNAVIDHYTVTSTPPGFGCASVAYANDDNPVLCNVTGLVAGTAYTFQIVAVGATGTGSSNSVSTGSITSGPPTVPQNVTATSTGLLAVRVTWSPPAITGPGITNYTVTSTPASSTCTQASSPCDFAGLTDTTSYVFHVQANGASSSGTSTADSAPIIAGSTTAPTAVTVATTAANTVRVTWGAPAVNAAHVASYSVTSSPPSTTCVTASPCDFTTLTPGTSYVFHVVAVGSAGYGNSPAADSSPIVPGPPSAPQNVTAAVTSAANVHVSWTRPANLGNGVATYTVTSTPGSAGCAGVAYVANDNPVGCDIAGLTTTQSYVFHVVAVGTNSSGTSVAGDALAVIPGPPDAPSPITVTTTGRGAVHLAWVRPAVRRAGIANYTVSSTPASAGCASVAYVNDDNPVGCDITGLDSHQTYVFHVYSVGLNSSGTSAAGDSAVTPVGPPDAPANATATITAANTATVSWTRPAFLGAGIASYTVTSTPASDGCSGVAYVANNNPVTCQVANLTAGTNYTFHVFAVGSSGSGTSDAADTVTVTSGPPSAPRTVTATVTSTGNVHVSWIRPINLGPGVANYTVTSTPGGFGCATVAYVNDDSTVGCDVSGLTSTQSYVFHVVANGINASGPSPAGDAPAVVPGPPGAPGTIVVTTPGPNTAHISWVRPASTGSSGIASYTVTSTPASAGCPTVAYVANDNPVTCDIAGLDSHQSYVFHIVANGVGNSGTSPVGDSQSTPVGPPDAPASVNATITAANQATVTWVRPALRGAGIASYTVTSTPASAGCSGVAYVNSGATVSCVVDGLTAGTGYVFHVVAVGSNSSGTSVAADTGTVTSGPPSAPRTVTATVTGSGNVTVSWIRPTTVGQGIADYTVTANAGTVICASVAYVANDNPVTCNATGLTATTSYTFHVYANGTGSSGTSVAGDSAAVTAGPPGAPGSVTVTTIAANTVHVSWVRPANLGAAGIANYTVTSTPSSAGCATVAYVANDNPVGCDIAGLNSHQTYVFHVVANGASSSGTSPAADSGSTPVGPPDGPASVSATITGPHEATVHWVRPTLRGAGIDHYTVTVNAGTAVCASVAYVANDNPLTCVASNLVSGTAYTFHVVAVGSNSSGSSVAVDATPVTAGPPDAPVDVRVVTDSSGTVHVSWVRPANQGAGIDHYTVTSAPTSDGCPSVDYVDDDTPVGCDITGLDANQTYVFSVVAVGTGLSGTSAAAVAGGGIVPTGRPSPPTDVQLVPGDFSLTVTWTGSDSPGPGIVRYTATADNGGAVCATPSSAETSCTITGLGPARSSATQTAGW